MRVVVLALTLVLAVQSPSRALLEWSDDLIVQRATASDTMATARYTFVNRSSRTITIKSIKPSCHCTTAELEQRVYAPGETGVIVARVDLTGRRGLVENTIEIEHDDGMLRIDRLRLNIEVAGVARITPTFHFWNVNGRGDTKVAVIEPLASGPFRVLRVEPSDRTFAWALARRNGRQELRISPRSLERRARTTFRITVQVGSDTAVQTVYAHVK